MKDKIIEISGRRFVTAATLAGLLDLHKRTILIWATEYGMPVISVGNMRLFDLADISDWFDKHKLVPKAQTVGNADKGRDAA
jgi:phage terminase Nu1 subunit (DNA packaging protein)